jgi:hypothetical protein
MNKPKRFGVPHAALALGILATLTACSSNPLSGGLSNAFGDSKSDFEITFLSASATWDMNKDNIVTCDEWKQYATRALQEADADRDNALVPAEWAAMARNDALFVSANHKYYDANGDGKVTIEELTGKQNLAFTMLDKNTDCQIAHDEKVNVYSVIKPKEKELDQRSPGGMGGGR